jgi:hypothetical protein
MRIAPITFLLSSSLAFAAAAEGSGQPIIIDTDLFGDVDDVGALTIANALHNCGLAELKGIAINTPSQYGAPAASVRVSYSVESTTLKLSQRPSVHNLATDMYR